MPTTAWAFAILAAASAAQAVTGFGFSLLAVSLLAVVTDVQTAVVASAIGALMLTAVTTLRERSHVDWPVVLRISAPAAVGLPVGLVILKTSPDGVLRIVVALVVLGSTCIVWLRPRIGSGGATMAAIGFIVGVLTTATATNGPPLVASFQSLGYEPRSFRATLAAIFTVCGAASVILFFLGGEIGGRSATLSLAGLPAILLGWWAGDHAFRRINADRFRAIVLIALVITSAVILIRTII